MKLPAILFLGLCLNVANATQAAALPLLPKIAATPAAVNFGQVGLGVTAVPKVITVKNTGKSALLVSSINTSGLNVDDFNQTNNCGTVQPGESCLINVTFTPSLPYAEKTAVLAIISNDAKKNPLKVKLTGKLPPPAIATTPAAVNFGKLPAETANSSKSVTIKNNGLSDLLIDSIAVTGSDSGDFTVSGTCGTIKKGEPCSISVLFAPRERNVNRSASLIITSNDPRKATLSLKLGGSLSNFAPAVIPQPGAGPGDQANYFPFTSGNSWGYHGVQSIPGQPETGYFRTAKVNGTKLVNGTETTVVTVSDSRDAGLSYDYYYFKADNGVYNYGNNDPDDTFTASIVPYPEIQFPVQAGMRFAQSHAAGLDSGIDLDEDGINDKVSVEGKVTCAGFETVIIPIGTYTAAARLERTEKLIFTLSSIKRSIQVIQTDVVYLAGGVGIIKQVQTISIPLANYSVTFTEELAGYLVDGQGKGVVAEKTLATVIAPENPATYPPGQPVVAFDGTNYLVVSQRIEGITYTKTGTIISPANTVMTSFDIGGGDIYTADYRVAYGGGHYLVAYTHNGQIVANRITPAGEVLDGPAGIILSSVNAGTTNFSPAIAFDGSNFLVAWGQYTTHYDIQAALITPQGQVLKEFTLFAAPGEQIRPAVAFDGTNYLVAWRDTRSGSGPATDTHIYATRVQPDGTVLDPAGIAVATPPASMQESPQLTFSNGQYLAVWVDFDNNGKSAIHGTRIGTDGSLLDGPATMGGFAINGPDKMGFSPSVAPFGNYFLVAWQAEAFVPPRGIYAARIDANGQLVALPGGGSAFPLSGSPPAPADNFIYPDLVSGGSNTLVVWINNRAAGGKYLQSAVLYPF